MITLTESARFTAGVVLLTIVGIEYGGLCLVRAIRSDLGLTDFQRSFFRAGHAHAGRPDLFDVPGVSPLHGGRHVLIGGAAQRLLHHRIDNPHNANPDEQPAGLHQELNRIDLNH